MKKELEELKNIPYQCVKTSRADIGEISNYAILNNGYHEYYQQSQNEIELRINENKILRSLLKNKEETIESLNKRFQNHFSVKSISNYYELYWSLLAKLKDMYECPISLDYLNTPIILPSGFTINEEWFDRLRDGKDPYNINLSVQHKIINRFAVEVREIINHSEDLVIEEENETKKDIKGISSQHLIRDIQTDNQNNWDNDISKKLDILGQLIDNLRNDQQIKQELIEKLELQLENNNQTKIITSHQYFNEESKNDNKFLYTKQEKLRVREMVNLSKGNEETKDYDYNNDVFDEFNNDSVFSKINSRY